MHFRIAVIGLVGWILTAAVAAGADPSPPPFKEIQALVAGYFHADPAYQTGDLVLQMDIAEVLAIVKEAGWVVPAGDKLVSRGVPNGSFLARELATPEGRPFMRKIARFPGAFSRLDRLSTISGGEKLISDLIEKPGGDKLVEYLATTKQGHNLGQMMSGVRQGVDLNKPTGRIYTQEELVAELKRRYSQTPATSGQ